MVDHADGCEFSSPHNLKIVRRQGQPQQGGCEGDSARDDISKIIRDMQNDWDTDYDIVRAIIHYLGTPITTTTEEAS